MISEEVSRVLADKFGTSVEHVWGGLITQSLIEGYALLLLISIIVISAIFVLPKTLKWMGSGDDGLSMLGHILGIVYAILALPIPFMLKASLSNILNPEYWALMQIMDKL